jgi:hypothetical protein
LDYSAGCIIAGCDFNQVTQVPGLRAVRSLAPHLVTLKNAATAFFQQSFTMYGHYNGFAAEGECLATARSIALLAC